MATNKPKPWYLGWGLAKKAGKKLSNREKQLRQQERKATGRKKKDEKKSNGSRKRGK